MIEMAKVRKTARYTKTQKGLLNAKTIEKKLIQGCKSATIFSATWVADLFTPRTPRRSW